MPPLEQSMHRRDSIGIAGAALTIGLAALLGDHFQPIRPVLIGLHALFAVAASGAIGLVLVSRAWLLEGASQPELYDFARLVSRWVYILMYILAIVRISLYLYESSEHCALCVATLQPVRPIDDFQFYVCCCVIPLWSIRAAVLAAPSRWFSRSRQPVARRLSATRA